LYWNHGRFPHFLGTSTSFSYTFNNEVVKKWFDKSDKETEEETTAEEMEGDEFSEDLEEKPRKKKRE
jgi:hypothetical protein